MCNTYYMLYVLHFTPSTKNKKMKIKKDSKYYFGDPCYVIKDDEDWDRFCDEFQHSGSLNIIRLKNGAICYAASTTYGDGCYSVKISEKEQEIIGEVFVDAGVLSVIEIIDDWYINPTPSDGVVFTATEDGVFEVEDCNWQGVISCITG